MKTRHFRELVVWQRAMTLTKNIYETADTFPRKEIFGLTSQIRRAAVSVPSNIAEGHGRLSDKQFAMFLGHARGSLYELETHLEIAHFLGYIKHESLISLLEKCAEIGRMLNGLLQTLNETISR
jgi:four helix bundle protein